MDEEQGAPEEQPRPAAVLSQLAGIVRAFGLERRLEDEPAHHVLVLERLADEDEPR